MEKSNKIALGIFVFGVVLPAAIILPLTTHKSYEDQNIAGIRDYKAGRYDVAIEELNAYLKVHPLVLKEPFGTSDYAEKDLGLALMKQHRYPEAESAFRIYSRCSAGDEGSYWLGVALFRDGNKTEARAKFQVVINNEMGQGMSTRDEALVNACYKRLNEMDHSH